MVKILLLFVTFASLFLSCSKKSYTSFIKDRDFLKEMKVRQSPVDIEILCQYSYSSISNEYKGFSATATFSGEDSTTMVHIDNTTLDKNKVYPSRHRHFEGVHNEKFIQKFKHIAGKNVLIKIPQSEKIAELNTFSYIPKTGEFKTVLNSQTNTIDLKWTVDESIPKNIMLVHINYNIGAVYNFNFDYSKGFASIDLNKLKRTPKDFQYIMVNYGISMAKTLTISNNKKVRIRTYISNRNIVYNPNNWK